MQIYGGLLVKNTILSFAGQAIPAVLTLLTIPYVIRGLGTERCGILALTWAVLGYFTVFDLVGRATIKFVAEYLGRGELEAIPRIIWTSLGLQTCLGMVGAVVLAAGTSLLITRGLKISAGLAHESQLAFRILALALPVVIGSRNLRGVLEAGQRFDLVAMVQIPTSSAASLMPALGIQSGFHLPGIMMLILLCWLVNAIAYVALCFRLFPAMRQWSVNRQMIRPLLSYGGWIAICNILLAIIGSLDRFLIGILISVKALAYYAPPAEMVFRLMIIPSVLGMTLFPAFCTLSVADPSHLENLYARSLKYVALLIGPTVVIAALFAGDILSFWLGREFASRSTAVFQLLLVGMFLTALGHMPANLLDGVGRPDLRAKTFFICITVYLPLVCVLTTRIGITGTALAWVIKSALELSIFLLQLRRLLPLRASTLVRAGFTRAIATLAALLLVAAAIKIAGLVLWVEVTAVAIALLIFAMVAWRHALDGSDRGGLSAILSWGRRTESRAIQLSPVP